MFGGVDACGCETGAAKFRPIRANAKASSPRAMREASEGDKPLAGRRSDPAALFGVSGDYGMMLKLKWPTGTPLASTVRTAGPMIGLPPQKGTPNGVVTVPA